MKQGTIYGSYSSIAREMICLNLLRWINNCLKQQYDSLELNWLRDCNICMKMGLFLEIWNLQMYCWMSMEILSCRILEIHENWLIYCLIVRKRSQKEGILELLIIWRQSYSQTMAYSHFKAIFGPSVVFSMNSPLVNLHSTVKPLMN